MSTHTKIPIANVIVSADRQRKQKSPDYIAQLAASIADVGLINPITVRRDGTLVAGECRLLACTSLGWTEIDCRYREDLTDLQYAIIEWRENNDRSELSWQDRCRTLVDLHGRMTMDALAAGNDWSLEATAKALGIDKRELVRAQAVVPSLQLEEVASQPNLTNALNRVVQIAERKAAVEAFRRAQATRGNVPSVGAAGAATTEDVILLTDPEQAPRLQIDVGPEGAVAPPTVNLTKTLFNVDCRPWLREAAAAGWTVDHIITDPPYAIDMDNLDQSGDLSSANTQTVRHTHDVEENLALLDEVLPLLHAVLAPGGFMVLWYDVEHRPWLVERLTGLGLVVQRWDFVWAKSGPCKNGAPDYNFTKAHETALVARRPDARMQKRGVRSFYYGGSEPNIAHPFAKPLLCWKQIYEAITFPGQTTLDPFAGGGSAVVAAIACGLEPIAIECDPVHFAELNAQAILAWKARLGENTRFI